MYICSVVNLHRNFNDFDVSVRSVLRHFIYFIVSVFPIVICCLS
jgi:hypothetical protein